MEHLIPISTQHRSGHPVVIRGPIWEILGPGVGQRQCTDGQKRRHRTARREREGSLERGQVPAGLRAEKPGVQFNKHFFRLSIVSVPEPVISQVWNYMTCLNL